MLRMVGLVLLVIGVCSGASLSLTKTVTAPDIHPVITLIFDASSGERSLYGESNKDSEVDILMTVNFGVLPVPRGSKFDHITLSFAEESRYNLEPSVTFRPTPCIPEGSSCSSTPTYFEGGPGGRISRIAYYEERDVIDAIQARVPYRVQFNWHSTQDGLSDYTEWGENSITTITYSAAVTPLISANLDIGYEPAILVTPEPCSGTLIVLGLLSYAFIFRVKGLGIMRFLQEAVPGPMRRT
jgi:hypothetical protein